MVLNSEQPILAFGDSLTFGYGTSQDKSYPAVLSQLSHLTVINASINGEISKNGLKRLEKLLAWYESQLLILCHGANDMIQKHSLSEMGRNLEAMIIAQGAL